MASALAVVWSGANEVLAGLEQMRQVEARELPVAAERNREFLIEKVCATGGHLGPDLGVVELTLALHQVFDSHARCARAPGPTLTADVDATLRQIAEVATMGCDLVRVAVPSADDAEALPAVVAKSPVPVTADIHFRRGITATEAPATVETMTATGTSRHSPPWTGSPHPPQRSRHYAASPSRPWSAPHDPQRRATRRAPRLVCGGRPRRKAVEKALELYGTPVYVRHEIIHNKYVVQAFD
ncbi:flavodoxin-dependent (E)-4-hydroxy-3-methylbut-2-enyl-diphosphate synthase [Streptomyces sp. NPDC048045]|uniref:flavodoxin-dependent (E)-4-hydroxy-3-methylbut-2-enyl-diphosphate synthase n=1 Tax=Streptomyces sp. NPDC048045 TaxID=3154710 RepID=UPI00342B339F